MSAAEKLTCIVIAPGGEKNAGLALSAARAGATGIVDLEYAVDVQRALGVLKTAAGRKGAGTLGVKLDGFRAAFWRDLITRAPDELTLAVLTFSSSGEVARQVRLLQGKGLRVLVETTCAKEALAAQEAGADGIIAKGNEAAGRVGESTTFMLLQQVLPHVSLPVYAQGGIGLHTAAACLAAGAAGVVLDWQVALFKESALPSEWKASLGRMDGRESHCFGRSLGQCYRLYVPRGAATGEMEAVERQCLELPTKAARLEAWRHAVEERIATSGEIIALSQDVSLAARFARKFRSPPALLQAIRKNASEHVQTAQALRPFAEGQGSSKAIGTRFPVIQGPMSRVSDTPEFAAAVAEAGGLPVMAGAMMDPDELTAMLEQTRDRLGDRPWAIGLLGFIDRHFYDRQVSLVKACPPTVAVLAGGSPAQARDLEAAGIRSYIHVPADRLLALFIQEGARNFVFEGRECGGHIGPFASFVLWENAVETLLENVPPEDAGEYDVWFAGGIHDELSAAMVAAIAAPLAERGIRVGLLLATAYLFTEEAVSTGAISGTYQECVAKAGETSVLDSGGGYQVRSAPCRFTAMFEEEKARMQAEGKTAEETRQALELLNLGRLRIAAKGVAFNVKSLKDPTEPMTFNVPAATQKKDGLFMAGQVIALHDRPTTLSALHEALCAGSTERLASLTLESPAVETIERSDRCEVAIIGMSCIFPKAGDLRSYWENILNSVYAITEVPADRWDWRRYFDADPNARDKIYSRWGGFIDPIVFDPMRFGIPPMSMKSVDPLQLFPLEVTRRALADAGYLDREYDKSRTGVFFGVAGGMGEWGLMYGFRSVLSLFLDHVPEELLSQLPEWTEDSFAGVLANVVAGRIANNFDFGGPNFTVDAACGSGLTAVYTGVNQIASGTCDMAVVGASDVMQNPFGFLCFSKSRALSPLGRPRPFDAGADGIAIGEGIAVVVLKRRDLAERDGDRMYAVIRGVGAGGDGRGASMTAPQTRGQMRAFDRAYQQAGFSIDSIELVEAHGTGTTLGDGVEARSLQEAQCEAGARARTCAVGSVKSMIGHTKGCAGIAGVIKSALALHYKVLPPTMGVDTPSPAECWGKDSPIYVNTETRPWIKSAGIRRAGVDAFGFGGSNFHVVLEEAWPGDEPTAFPMATWPCELFCWCAASGTALQEALRGFRVKLDAAEGATLKDLSALVTQTALAAPTEGVRVALVAETRDDLAEKIDAALKALADGVESIKDPRGIYYSAKPARRDGRVAFVFPGQGSQRPDMLRDLAVLFPEVRERFTMADRVTQGCYAKPLSEFVYPPPRFSPAEEKQCMSELTVTHVAQPALAAASMSLMHIWELLGVRPEMTAGHSVAEYAALCAAGVFDEETLYDILEYRGRCIVESCKGDMGTMLAVKGGVDDVAALVEKFDDVHVANLNSPAQTILSGRKGDLEQVTASLAKQGIKSRPIPVSCAFHSPFVEPARKALAERLASMTFHSPAMPVYSNTLGGMYPPDQDDMRSILAEQLVKSVRFTEEIDAMYEAGARIFVEVGPGNVMTNLVKQILGDRPHVVVACDAKSPRHDLFQLLHAVAELVSEGVGVKPGVLFDRRTVAELSPETLRPTAAAEKLSPVSWMLGPDRAWPLSESKPVRRPISLAAAPAAGAVPGKAPGMGSIPPPAATDDPKRAEALVRYQKLMNEFLEQQRDVMLAFLGDGSAPLSVPSVAGATAIAAPTPPAAVPEPLTAPAASVPEPKATGSLMQLLVDIVSERTGYPPEMLDQDLDMEADLGIDSIKRVEILTVFGKRVPNPPPDLAERLGVTRTLRQVMETVGEVANAAPDAPQAAPAAPSGDMTAALVGLVSERTGYPPEMLDLDLDMEADLGIDSIKRVEILTAFGKTVPSPPADLAERMGTARTLQQVLDMLLSGAAGGPATAADETAPETPGAAAAPARIERGLVELHEAPLTGKGNTVLPDGVVLVTDDGKGCAAALCRRIAELGGEAVLLSLDAPTEATDTVQLDLADAQAVETFVDGLREERGAIGGVVHLLPLRDTPQFPDFDAALWQKHVNEEIKGLFNLLRFTACDLKQSNRKWALACTSLGTESSNGHLPHPSRPWRGGIMGLMKSLAAEWGETLCKVLDVDQPVPDLLVDWILNELARARDDHEVYYLRKTRWVPSVSSVPIVPGEHSPAIERDDVILIIGGARGITAEIAREIATTARPTIVLAGRSPWPGEESDVTAAAQNEAGLKKALFEHMRADGGQPRPIEVEQACRRILMDRQMKATRQALESAGSRVAYIRADVQDPDDFARLLAEIEKTYGRLDGVVNGAGVIEDKLLEEKDPQSFARVFDIKAMSVFLMGRLLKPESLKFVVLFSSVAGWFGNPGQTDYAAANEVINRMSMYLSRQWERRVVAVNWGPWAASGMVSDGVAAQFRARGLELVDPAAGRRYLLDELAGGRPDDALVIAYGAPV